MKFDLKSVPFSTKGSYMAISFCPENFRNYGMKEGLYLRSVHGNSRFTLVAELVPLVDGSPCSYELEAEPYSLCIRAENKKMEFIFLDADTWIAASADEGMGLRMDTLSRIDGFNMIQPVRTENGDWYLLNSFKSYTRYMMRNVAGEMELHQTWVRETSPDSVVDFTAGKNGMLVMLKEMQDVWEGCPVPAVASAEELTEYVEEKRREAREKYEEFRDAMPEVPEEYESGREIAAYVNYSSFVNPKGFLTRPGMLMSKNWMTKIWSWDHCFNALALAYHLPEEAWNQFLLPFDHQSPSGRIPDSVEDSLIIDNYCKPPIHGWALGKLRKIMKLKEEQLKDAYQKIGNLTMWWLNDRDQDGDGLCEYTHGNDSGWDNATAFSMLPPVVSPDLAAFLIVQMDELAEVADELGKPDEAEEWKRKSKAMLEKMLGKLFVDGCPVARQALTDEIIPNESLILYLPVILGKRLPEDIRRTMTEVLKSERFLTEYGWATENPKSSNYISDGYWRGPVWAPSTFLLLEGVRACGEEELAKEVARRFCGMVTREGCAENFDALSGKGLRDRAYTWTGSAMLVIAHEYCMEKER